MEILGPLLRTVEEGDTLQLEARALDANGDVVPDAVILWAVVDTAVVGFTIGETTGLVETTAPDTGRVAAIADELPSEPVLIQVSRPPTAWHRPRLRGTPWTAANRRHRP